jgi:hypothetical protein
MSCFSILFDFRDILFVPEEGETFHSTRLTISSIIVSEGARQPKREGVTF